jgi:hypothetical protein
MILASFTKIELQKFSYPQPFLKGLVIVQSSQHLCQAGICYMHLLKCNVDIANNMCRFSCIQACITECCRSLDVKQSACIRGKILSCHLLMCNPVSCCKHGFHWLVVSLWYVLETVYALVCLFCMWTSHFVNCIPVIHRNQHNMVEM